MRQMSQVDKQSILNPIIDELGILSPDVKNKVISHVELQLDRIINEHVQNALKGLSNQILNTTTNLSTSYSQLDLSIKEHTSKYELTTNNLSKVLETLIKEFISLRTTVQPTFISEEQADKKLSELTEDQLKQMKFVELSRLAKKKNIEIPSRSKKQDIIELILAA